MHCKQNKLAAKVAVESNVLYHKRPLPLIQHPKGLSDLDCWLTVWSEAFKTNAACSQRALEFSAQAGKHEIAKTSKKGAKLLDCGAVVANVLAWYVDKSSLVVSALMVVDESVTSTVPLVVNVDDGRHPVQ